MLEKIVRKLYLCFIRPYFFQELHLQRLKLIWFVWGYLPLFSLDTISSAQKFKLLSRYLRIDWNVLHSHRPCEIAAVVCALTQHPAEKGEVMIETGCWNGGSSAKFSIACKMFGFQLHIFDSFEGVQQLSEEEKSIGYDFSGEYSAPQSILQQNLARFGEIDVCHIHPGWFSDTLANSPVEMPVNVVFIDCDSASGTQDVLVGVTHCIVPDGCIFTQDFHITSVRNLLMDPGTWVKLNVNPPKIHYLCGNLSVLKFVNE